MVLADKGFLIQDIVPNGVSLNIPPFLNNGTFTESEARAAKAIAKCRIHVERANGRLKDFKILSFIPSYLRCHAGIIFQLCASLDSLQFPLIKEACERYVFYVTLCGSKKISIPPLRMVLWFEPATPSLPPGISSLASYYI